MIASPSADAANPTATITVKWNTQSVSSMTVATDYTVAAGVATGQTTAPVYLQTLNSGNGSCMPASVATVAATVDFENVTPDTSGTASKYTDCLYKNAVDVHVFTTDALGYGLNAAGTLPFSGSAGADVAGGPYLLCLISAAGGAFANNTGAANAVASTAAAAPQLDNGGTHGCANISHALTAATTAGTGGTILASQASPTGANGADFSMDMELGIPTLAVSGAQTFTETFTLALN